MNEIIKKSDLKYFEPEGIKFDEKDITITLYYLNYDYENSEKVYFVDSKKGDKYGAFDCLSKALTAARIAIKNNKGNKNRY